MQTYLMKYKTDIPTVKKKKMSITPCKELCPKKSKVQHTPLLGHLVCIAPLGLPMQQSRQYANYSENL